ncbi:hypothetical protein EZJ19_07785 [Parasulfuritortus cantonensis]|uniref:DUF1640 domain-containing protein n=1 Tax=Parasulfuritortus cantonensis TaxID=2528202 RepID=A0A4R1BDP2_9PROT|nr:hypothetical protein [Parasulfuritortus cantonensis]TCJ15200.1 hypothetical protein EZJ19_07785 [Parasulfuritortus cantonensis]
MQAATALSIIEAFEAVNIPHDKARAVVEALEKEMFDQLATKTDLALMQASINAKFDVLSRDLTIRLGVMLTVAVGVVATLVQLF